MKRQQSVWGRLESFGTSAEAKKNDSPPNLVLSLPPSHQIHLRQDVKMRTLQADHTTHRAHHSGKELGFVLHELGFEEVRRADAEVASLLEEGGESREERDVGVEFDLT